MSSKLVYFLLICGLTCLIACSFHQSSNTSSDLISTAFVAKNYTNYQKITPQPVLVNSVFAWRCSGFTQHDIDAARLTNGPHAFAAITIYMNDLAGKTFSRSSNVYPVGAVIVKVKYFNTNFPITFAVSSFLSKTSDEFTYPLVNGVGGMIKRPPGYDPTNGDWEYFYFDEKLQLQSGPMQSCVQCHQSARAKDFVFGNWSKSIPD